MIQDRELEIHALMLLFQGGKMDLRPDYFFNEDLRNIFTMKLEDQDLNLFDSKIKQELQDEIMDNNMNWFNLSTKGTRKNLIDLYNKRETISLTKRLMKNIEGNYQDILTQFHLENCSEVHEVNIEKTIDKLIDDMMYEYENDVAGVRTGIKNVDRLLGNIPKGSYMLIGARPSVGKSIVGREIADYNLKKKRKVQIFSLEMPKEMYFQRWVFAISRVNQNFHKNRILTEGHKSMIKEAGEYLKTLSNLKIIDEPCTIIDIEEKVEQFKPDVVVIDYLQYIKAHMRADKRIVVEDISQRLKELAKKHNCVMVVISSLNRAQKGSENKVPHMSDLKETGNLEFDADIISLLHRNQNDGVYEDELRTFITKNRNGQCGVAVSHVNGNISRIE